MGPLEGPHACASSGTAGSGQESDECKYGRDDGGGLLQVRADWPLEE